MESGIYDIVGLAKDLELKYEDITDLYISYIEEVEMHCVNLNEIFYKNDFMELISEVHNVKGVAANLLLKDVFEEADLFERLLKKGDFASSKEHVESLLNLLINSKDKITKSFVQVNVII
ncbi:MAG: HPt (histidine-containing phosphotransfer) domain-containing protein [Clostridium sp.]|jgi:HPt (histidine-containing phosphotransfer) domain-containing protein